MAGNDLVISGTGVFTPPCAITTPDLVEAYNLHVDYFNARHANDIAAGKIAAKTPSSVEFILKASGIENRYVMEASGIFDFERMAPHPVSSWQDDEREMPAQLLMAWGAAEEALVNAGLTAADIDLVLFSSSIVERHAPSMAIGLQDHLGTSGFAYDMQMGCSSATFGIAAACAHIKDGMATRVLVVTAEYLSPVVDFTNRDSHFIFGDAAVATIVEREEVAKSDCCFRILSKELHTDLSYNIAADWSFTDLMTPERVTDPRMKFRQEGRKVFKELLPMVCDHLEAHLANAGLAASDLRRVWLHQANENMNRFAAKRLLGHDATQDESPIILKEYANTGGAGVVIAFNKYNDDFRSGEKGLIASFGAGYSIGSILIERV